MFDADFEGYYLLRLVQERTDGADVWTASHPQLLGCHALGRTPDEAVNELDAVREEWIRRAGLIGEQITKPSEHSTWELTLATDHTVIEAARAQDAIQAVANPTVFSEPWQMANVVS